ncbi:aminoacyl-tRNA hydrolase [Patescibacteria group bacterium]|nr:aminoacyl-tRNA hydrolase [Patescibacteria group bacterium]MBU1721432.1 aminoacyl-tRNA hydrolase [Patescibacteria group bacterium]MBU1901575.1 aminoacyl-tRNA hydrolase [Patescibacteria group bacterium]
MRLIVGLGNPGKSYEKTRHNVGFMILDALHHDLAAHNINNWELSKKFNAQIAGCSIAGEKIILIKPMTFMNRSGESVGLIAQYYKIIPEEIVVIQDDKDIPLGEYKVQTDRGHAGHNGIKSIMQHIGTKNFTRFRVGVASSNTRKMHDMSKFVLGNFGLFEKRTLDSVSQSIRDHIFKDFLK